MAEMDYYDILDDALNKMRFMPFQLQPCFKQIIEITNKLDSSKQKYRKIYKRLLLKPTAITSQERETLKKLESQVDRRFARKTKKINKLLQLTDEIHASIMSSEGMSMLKEKKKVIKESSCVVETFFLRDKPNKNEIVCFCKRGAWGTMILCESELCPVGWYHLVCTSYRKPPKTSFICRLCMSRKIFK